MIPFLQRNLTPNAPIGLLSFSGRLPPPPPRLELLEVFGSDVDPDSILVEWELNFDLQVVPAIIEELIEVCNIAKLVLGLHIEAYRLR